MRVSGSAPASYLLRLESLIRGRRIITPVGRTNARQSNSVKTPRSSGPVVGATVLCLDRDL
jgi:hypothetical protein